MRRRPTGTWLQPLLFADETEDVTVPEELRGQVVAVLAQLLLNAATDRVENEGGGANHESQDPT